MPEFEWYQPSLFPELDEKLEREIASFIIEGVDLATEALIPAPPDNFPQEDSNDLSS